MVLDIQWINMVLDLTEECMVEDMVAEVGVASKRIPKLGRSAIKRIDWSQTR